MTQMQVKPPKQIWIGRGQDRRLEVKTITGEEAAVRANRARLTAALGRLIAPEMKLPIKLYDMESHYKLVKDKWFGFAGGLKE